MEGDSQPPPGRASRRTLHDSFEYTYDDDGLRTSCTREDGDVITYGYDDLNRLVDEWRKEGENTVYRRQYEYDRVGNRTKLTKTDGENSTVYGYTYNGLGQLATEYWPYSSPTSRNVYSYDANGNLVEKLEQYGSPGSWGTEYTWTYYWDTQDRLIKVEKYDEAGSEYDVCVEYKYCPSCGGAMSERIEYESDRETVKSWLRYQYHGLNLLRIDEKYNSNGEEGIQSTDQWRVLDWYVHGPGQIGQIVRAIAYTYNQNTTNTPCDTMEYYYCYDAVGNVNGVLQDGTYYRWEMDAFGNGLAGGNEFLPMTSEGPKEHQTGKMFDGETGLYYFRARWFSPQVGRFIGRDPFVSEIPHTSPVSNGLFDPALMFPYAYAANNPTTWYDDSGYTVNKGYVAGVLVNNSSFNVELKADTLTGASVFQYLLPGMTSTIQDVDFVRAVSLPGGPYPPITPSTCGQRYPAWWKIRGRMEALDDKNNSCNMLINDPWGNWIPFSGDCN